MFYLWFKIDLSIPSDCNSNIIFNYYSYFLHSRDPSIHSWIVPIIKITIKIIDIMDQDTILSIFISTGIGINKVISTSKIRKITATRKKCNEKGTRAEDLGSYPHSKGDPFSRSIFFFIAIPAFRTISRIDSPILNNTINNIILSLWGLSNWKLGLLFIIRV